jgi:hypothetical protein
MLRPLVHFCLRNHGPLVAIRGLNEKNQYFAVTRSQHAGWRFTHDARPGFALRRSEVDGRFGEVAACSRLKSTLQVTGFPERATKSMNFGRNRLSAAHDLVSLARICPKTVSRILGCGTVVIAKRLEF